MFHFSWSELRGGRVEGGEREIERESERKRVSEREREREIAGLRG